MRIVKALAALACVCAVTTSAAQTPAPPVTVRVKAGLVVLKAPSGGEAAWDWDERLIPNRPEHQTIYVAAAARELVLAAPPGSYRVTCTVWDAGKAPLKQVYYVTFEGGPTPPPTPLPETFESRLRVAYDADKATGKAKDEEARFLSSIYAQAGQFLKLPQTTGQVFQLIDLAVGQAVTTGGLPSTLKVIDARLQEVQPRSKDAPLTEPMRAGFRDSFTQIARAVASLIGPQPPPDPDGPSPIPEAGLRVLIVYESSMLTAAQNLVISGAEVRGYVTGKSGQFRAYDQNADLTNETEWVKNAAKRPRKSVPWIIVSNHPKGGEEVPLPVTVAETISLLKKWGER